MFSLPFCLEHALFLPEAQLPFKSQHKCLQHDIGPRHRPQLRWVSPFSPQNNFPAVGQVFPFSPGLPCPHGTSVCTSVSPTGMPDICGPQLHGRPFSPIPTGCPSVCCLSHPRVLRRIQCRTHGEQDWPPQVCAA